MKVREVRSIENDGWIEEVKRLMQEGIEFHLAGMREDGLPIPAPMTQVDYAEVA
jgi:predicted RNase H-like HicB family nuclease